MIPHTYVCNNGIVLLQREQFLVLWTLAPLCRDIKVSLKGGNYGEEIWSCSIIWWSSWRWRRGCSLNKYILDSRNPNQQILKKKNDNSHKLDMLLPHIAKMSLRQTTCALTAEIMNWSIKQRSSDRFGCCSRLVEHTHKIFIGCAQCISLERGSEKANCISF